MKGFRTMAIMAASALPMILTIMADVGSAPEWMAVVPEQYHAIWALVTAVAGIWLRLITTTPVGRY